MLVSSYLLRFTGMHLFFRLADTETRTLDKAS